MSDTPTTSSTDEAQAAAKVTKKDDKEEPASAAVAAADAAAADADDSLTGLRLVLVLTATFLSTLLAALELGIVSTAIPGITDAFHRLDDVGWYGSAAMMAAGVCSPVWSVLYKYTPLRIVYLASIVLFLVASIVAATASSSAAVIVGRALQGTGGSGTISGSVLVIHHVSPPRHHPALVGAWMAVFMLSMILGPIVGGALTTGASWRWCFWINLPVGGAVLVMLLLFLHLPAHVRPYPASWTKIVAHLDLPGFALLLGSLVCLTLGLQTGGQTRPWHDGAVIAELVLFGVFSFLFVVVEKLQGDRAMIPLRLLRPRIVWANLAFTFCSNAGLYGILFYLPIYLQSIDNQSAIMSGVNVLPLLAFFAAGSMISGLAVGKTRLLQPFELVGTLISVAGVAIFYTLDIGSSKGRYVGAQVLYGLGMGIGYQVPMTAVQTFSAKEDVPSISGILIMAQAGSGGYVIPLAQSLFANFMLRKLRAIAPRMDTSAVLATGASEIRKNFQGDELAVVLESYMAGIKDVFIFTLASTALAAVLCLAIPLIKLPALPALAGTAAAMEKTKGRAFEGTTGESVVHV